LRERAGALNVQDRAPEPILKGRDLIQLGMTPSPDFGPILDAAYDAQIEGRFFTLDEAFAWLAAQPELPLPDSARAALKRPGMDTN
jgi:tRNA nucleotidyltransferase (CCA-adding enzyme)